MIRKPQMNRIRQYLCGVLAIAMLLPAVPGSAAKAEKPTGEMPAAAGDGNGYFAYYDQYSAKPYFSEPISIDADSGELAGGAAAETGYIQMDRSVRLDKDGSVTWTVSVPQDGRFVVNLTYAAEKGSRKDSIISLTMDGQAPFAEAESVVLTRLWKDAAKIQQDQMGNDKIPEQEQVMEWQTAALQDFGLFTTQPLIFFLTKGIHTVTITNVGEPLHIAEIELAAPPKIQTDEEARASYAAYGYQEVPGYFEKIQMEEPYRKSSQSIYPTYDRSNPATEPYDVFNIRRNTIGDGNWADPGTWLTYVIDNVPEDGLYYITLKYRQNQMTGTSTFRTILVNGVVPSQAFENVAFPYNVKWKNQTISDAEGTPCAVYLKKGTNEIRLQATVGKWADVLRHVDEANQRLNEMYIQMIMVTGTTPDKYFDYNLEKEIPQLLDVFARERDVLAAQVSEFERLNGGKATQSEILRGAVSQLDSMLKDPKSIPQRLGNFRDTISALSSWVYDNMNQSVEMDYMIVHSAGQSIPKAEAGFWAKLKHAVISFFLSFIKDYDMIGQSSGTGESITVWVNSGRDQASILMNMITEDFTSETGIQVNVSLVQTGFIEATLAGTGPDVAIGVSRGQPVNLACRGALEDLSHFEGFEEVVSRFGPTATVPYQYDGGTYGIPNTQGFFMMYYRKDILERLGLELPQTWDELLRMVPRLQKKHMEIGLPYSVISAAAAVENGMGAKDIFPVLLLQNGGDLYNERGTASSLDSEISMSAFKQWCEYYNQYGFELIYDFYTRFRNGDMPIGIADLSYYNALVAGAPELRGKWSIAPIPGTLQPDGTVDRSTGSIGSATVMFKNAENKEASWKFIEWWTRAKTQDTYNTQIENVMGPAGRNATANLESFSHLPWTDDEFKALNIQRTFVKDLREVPGSYFVSRCLDNAFRAVLYDGENPREVLEREVETINREIARKRKELGLD